jgi:hypothetical protein
VGSKLSFCKGGHFRKFWNSWGCVEIITNPP